MKEISPITLDEYSALLKRKGNAVPWNPPEMAQPVSDFRCILARLETSDEERVFFWWEHRVHTAGESGKWTDVLATAACNPRIKRFLEGDAANGWQPVDLRAADGFEPMLITNDFDRGPLLVIDGNHRLESQRIRGDDLASAKVYVCCHPVFLGHGYMTSAARAWARDNCKV